MLRAVKNFLFCILSSALLFFAFPDFQASIFAWIAFVPFFFAIETTSSKRSFFYSYAAGVIFFGGILYWLTHVTKPGYVVMVLYTALFFGLFGLLFRIFINRLRSSKISFLLFIMLPALWVSLEYARGVLFTGFPWAILGYSQYKNHPVIQIADLTGPYGVSFAIIMVNFVVYAALSNLFKRTRHFHALNFQIAASIAIAAAVVVYGYLELDRENIYPGIGLSVVQGNIEQSRKWDPDYKDHILDRYEALTRKAAPDGGDLVIWPETSVPGFLDEEDVGPRIRAIAKNSTAPLFLGVVTYEPGLEKDRYFNSAALFSHEGAIEKKYDKSHLVPLGEYVPFEEYFPFTRDFIDVPIGDYTPGKEYTLFDISRNGVDFKYAALICFEDIFPGLVRTFALNGADFAINITNDAWFKESGEQLQHTQASVFRAVENRIGVVRAANTGFSCSINPHGVIEDSIYDAETGNMYVEGCKTFKLAVSGKKSFYTRYGDIFAYFCIALVLAALFPLTFFT